MDLWSIILSIVIGVIGVYYLFETFNFFKRHGIIHIPVYSNMSLLVLLRQISVGDAYKKMYNYNPDAKYIGVYVMTKPVFFLRDPDLIQDVLVKDFKVLPNRGFIDFTDPLLSKNLFSLKGDKWKKMRHLLTPSFTPNKLKTMFTEMSECAANFVQHLSALPVSDSDLNIKGAFTKYTNDVIATCAFGIRIDSMKDPDNKFYVYGKDMTNFSGFRSLKLLFITTFPKLAKILNVRMLKKEATDFFRDCIQTTIAARDAKNIRRSDMLQLMMDLKDEEGRRKLDVDEMVAQAFVFFFAGLESTSTAMCFAAHLLAANPHVQIKLRQEIDNVLEKGEVTYEAINRLEYLEAIINETLRMYTPSAFLERMCETNYELPPALPSEKSFVMKKDTIVWIPVFPIHYDEKFYDNPEEFRPERFMNNAYHNSRYYLPFGAGQRMCIAYRFAMLEMKVLLFHLVVRCKLKPCAKTTLPMRFRKKVLQIYPENGFWLNIQRRSDVQSILESTVL